MRKTAPCFNCQERYLGCHDRCSKYQEFRVNRNHFLKEQRKRNDLKYDYHYYKTDAIKRMSR